MKKGKQQLRAGPVSSIRKLPDSWATALQLLVQRQRQELNTLAEAIRADMKLTGRYFINTDDNTIRNLPPEKVAKSSDGAK